MSELNEIQFYEKFLLEKYYNPKQDIPFIKKIHKVQEATLGILEEIDRVCSKFDLKFFPYFGTLLGCVRHQGFVPWDDDVDIVMLREEFELFIACFESEKTCDYQLLKLYEEKEGYTGSYIRVIDKNTTVIELNKDWKRSNCQGIWVDILPLDSLYEEESRNNISLLKEYQNIIRCKETPYKRHKGLYDVETFEDYHVKANKYTFEELQKMIREYAINNDENATKCGVIISNAATNRIAIFDKDELKHVQKVKFEVFSFMIPKNYNSILQKLYGLNYMSYPPINQRFSSSNRFYDTSEPYEVYQKRFFDWKNLLKSGKVIVFGAGHMMLNFLNNYGHEYLPVFVVDNDLSKVGRKIKDINYAEMYVEEEFLEDIFILESDLGNLQIKGANKLKNDKYSSYHIIICSSYYREIGQQLKEMDITEYFIYVQNHKWLINEAPIA